MRGRKTRCFPGCYRLSLGHGSSKLLAAALPGLSCVRNVSGKILLSNGTQLSARSRELYRPAVRPPMPFAHSLQ